MQRRPCKPPSRNSFDGVAFFGPNCAQECKPRLFPLANKGQREIRALYDAHRIKRNALQREKFISPDFKELVIDQYLLRLENPSIQPGFQDERNCLVFWARPPEHVIKLAAKLQQMLQRAAPGNITQSLCRAKLTVFSDIWLMPTYRMHLTALEVAFSKTPQEIEALVATLRPAIPAITSYTHLHRSRLVRPLISYDLSAFAVSFLPAAGDKVLSPPPVGVDTTEDVTGGDDYTYHHLRRDVFDKVQHAGVEVGSRYQVPSAHITLGRYLSEKDHDTPEKRKRWVEAIDEVNKWLWTRCGTRRIPSLRASGLLVRKRDWMLATEGSGMVEGEPFCLERVFNSDSSEPR